MNCKLQIKNLKVLAFVPFATKLPILLVSILIVFQPIISYSQDSGINLQSRYETMKTEYRSDKTSLATNYWQNNINLNLGKMPLLPFQSIITSNITMDMLRTQVNVDMNTSWDEKYHRFNIIYNESGNFVKIPTADILSIVSNQNLGLNFSMNEPGKPYFILNYQGANANQEIGNYSQTKNENFLFSMKHKVGIFQVSLDQSVTMSESIQPNVNTESYLAVGNLGISFNKTLGHTISIGNKYYLQSNEEKSQQTSGTKNTETQNINLDTNLVWSPSQIVTVSVNNSLRKNTDKSLSQDIKNLTNNIMLQYVPSNRCNLQILFNSQEPGNNIKSNNLTANLGLFLNNKTNLYMTTSRMKTGINSEQETSNESLNFRLTTKIDKTTNFNFDYQKNKITSKTSTSNSTYNFTLNGQLFNTQKLTAYLTSFMTFTHSSSPAISLSNKTFSNSVSTSWQLDNKTSILYNYMYNKNYGGSPTENFSGTFDFNKRVDNKTILNIRYLEQNNKNAAIGTTSRTELSSGLSYVMYKGSQMSFEYRDTKNNTGEVKGITNLSGTFNLVF